MQLVIDHQKQGNVLVLAMEGRLQGTDSAEFQDKIMKWIEENEKRILVDLSKCTRVDSLGLRAFIMASNKLKATQGRMILCNMQRIVEDVFDISGFSSFFEIMNSREEALESLKDR